MLTLKQKSQRNKIIIAKMKKILAKEKVIKNKNHIKGSNNKYTKGRKTDMYDRDYGGKKSDLYSDGWYKGINEKYVKDGFVVSDSEE